MTTDHAPSGTGSTGVDDQLLAWLGTHELTARSRDGSLRGTVGSAGCGAKAAARRSNPRAPISTTSRRPGSNLSATSTA